MKTNIIVGLTLLALTLGATETIIQSSRTIPIIRESDVVVVGGSSAAVAAAIAAKESGADVFLVAPRTALGSDLADTRELWQPIIPEYYNHEFAKKLFDADVPYTYIYSATPASAHPDPNHTRLRDGVNYSAVRHSVEFRQNMFITLTFLGQGNVASLELYYYLRANAFDTEVSKIEYSSDGSTWTEADITTDLEEIIFIESENNSLMKSTITLDTPVEATYLRVYCDLAGTLTRQLLDELIVYTDSENPLPGSYLTTTPLTLKRNLDTILEEAEIPFLCGTPVCDVLRDNNNKPAGVVIANRSGRQAITARVVIDATDNAIPAIQAGAVKTPFTPGDYEFSRIVIADVDDPPAAANLSVSPLTGAAYEVSIAGVAPPEGAAAILDARIYRCKFTANLTTGSMLELLEIEQLGRDLTWSATCTDQADRLIWMPPDHIVGVVSESATTWSSAAALDLDAFRPQGVDYFYLLSVRGDVPRSIAAALQHPVRMFDLAERVGVAAANQALNRAPLSSITLPSDTTAEPDANEIRELAGNLSPSITNATGSITEPTRELPVLAECDVVVVGAGTAGAPAAIAAGRAGADTIVVDMLFTMGGVQTDGRIGKYYSGNNCGFSAKEVDPGWQETGSILYTAKAEWYRQECLDAGVRVLFGTTVNGAVVNNNGLVGVVVVLPDGKRGIIKAKTVIDSTGNADVAAAAGAKTTFITADEAAVQGAGWGRHVLGNSMTNNDIGFVNDCDAADISFFARRVRKSMPTATWDAGHNPASRERRRIVGSVVVSPIDIKNERTWPDTIVTASSDFDTHGFTTHDLFMLQVPGTEKLTAHLPFRALVPVNLENILVTGLGISAHRDAMPVLRMQRDVQNQGYAAGYAAALALQNNVSVRNVDIATLQAHLVAKEIITPEQSGTTDSFPLPTATIQSAVTGVINNFETLHTLLADIDTALPMLKLAYNNTTVLEEQLVYAQILALLGNDLGAQILADKIAASIWDSGWNYTGMGQVGASISLLDSYIIALGRTQYPYTLSALHSKAGELTAKSALSHYRAIAFAYQNMRPVSAIQYLSALLAQIRGNALSTMMIAPEIPDYSNTQADLERNNVLRELTIARVLYQLGDDTQQNAKEVLQAYANDPREVYATHARLILTNGVSETATSGIWISTAPNAAWNDPGNWSEGIIAQGFDAVAYFTNTLTQAQTITLDNQLRSIGSLYFAGGERSLVNGVIEQVAADPIIAVAADSQAHIYSDLAPSDSNLAKEGDGKLTIYGATFVNNLDVTEGDLYFADVNPAFYQAYSTDVLQHNTTANNTTLRTDFRVNQTITITHLGAYDSDGDGFEETKKIAIFNLTDTATPLAEIALATYETYPLEDGYRFRPLPKPLVLSAGNYALVTHGFVGNDRYIKAFSDGVGSMAGTLDTGNNAITFLNDAYYLLRPLTVKVPTVSLNLVTPFGVGAGSFRFMIGSHIKNVNNTTTIHNGSKLGIGSIDTKLRHSVVFAGSGIGKITNNAPYRVSLTLGAPAGTTNEFNLATVCDSEDAPVTLVKSGEGRLDLLGSFNLHGELHTSEGVVTIESCESLNGRNLSYTSGAQFMPRNGGVMSSMIYTPSSERTGDGTRFIVPTGKTVTLSCGLECPNTYNYAGFVIQPQYDLDGSGSSGDPQLTTVIMNGTRIGYLDLYLKGDRIADGNTAAYSLQNISGHIRKLACGHESIDGCSITFGDGCDFQTDWFDIAYQNASVSITPGVTIKVGNELRFVDGFLTQLSLDGGFLLTPVIGSSSDYDYNITYKPLRLNGTVVQATKNNAAFINFSETSANPLVCNGGAIFDTDSYNITVKGKSFQREPESTGGLTKLGTGILTLGTIMDYIGNTVISNGTLNLDFATASPDAPLNNLLNPSTSIKLMPGSGLQLNGGVADSAYYSQQLTGLEYAGSELQTLNLNGVDLTTHELSGNWEKNGSGTLTLQGSNADQTPLTGTLMINEGPLVIRGYSISGSVNIPFPGFESDPLLPPTGGPGNKDKRGAAAALGCPGWSFTAVAGYQRNPSYFADTEAAMAPEGVQAAFILRDESFETELEFPFSGNYTLTCAICPRIYYNNTYTNHIVRVLLDNVEKWSVATTDACFKYFDIPLGWVTAGTYTLKFAGYRPPEISYDSGSIIDDISINGSTDVHNVNNLSSDTSTIVLSSGVKVELDYPGHLGVGKLIIDGISYSGGTFGAHTHPDIFTGTGTIRPQPPGTLILIR